MPVAFKNRKSAERFARAVNRKHGYKKCSVHPHPVKKHRKNGYFHIRHKKKR